MSKENSGEESEASSVDLDQLVVKDGLGRLMSTVRAARKNTLAKEEVKSETKDVTALSPTLSEKELKALNVDDADPFDGAQHSKH